MELSGLVDIDTATGNYKQAFKDYQRSVLYKDSLINKNTSKTTMLFMQSMKKQKQKLNGYEPLLS